MIFGLSLPNYSSLGQRDAITEQVQRYAGPGVDELVIEPAAAGLDDFIGQMTTFATEVARLAQ
jgi:hypothetical protein